MHAPAAAIFDPDAQARPIADLIQRQHTPNLDPVSRGPQLQLPWP
jgi:hypothetical protein